MLIKDPAERINMENLGVSVTRLLLKELDMKQKAFEDIKPNYIIKFSILKKLIGELKQKVDQEV